MPFPDHQVFKKRVGGRRVTDVSPYPRPQNRHDQLNCLNIYDLRNERYKPARPPAVLCILGSKRVVSILDTGANVSVMSKDLFYNLPKYLIKSVGPPPDTLNTASGEKLITQGCAEIYLEIGGRRYTYEFYIVENLMKAMILGNNFMDFFDAHPTRTHISMHGGRIMVPREFERPPTLAKPGIRMKEVPEIHHHHVRRPRHKNYQNRGIQGSGSGGAGPIVTNEDSCIVQPTPDAV